MSVDNLGLTTRFRYSSLDRMVQLTDPNGPAGATIDRRSVAGTGMSVQTNDDGNVTDYVWDAAGRKLREQRTLTRPPVWVTAHPRRHRRPATASIPTA